MTKTPRTKTLTLFFLLASFAAIYGIAGRAQETERAASDKRAAETAQIAMELNQQRFGEDTVGDALFRKSHKLAKKGDSQ